MASSIGKLSLEKSDFSGSQNAQGGSALTRLLQILDMFSLARPCVSVDEVVEAFGMGQSTAYRYLRELSDAGLLAPQRNGLYSLGRRIVELDRLLQQSDPLLLAGKAIMDRLEKYAENRSFLLCAPYHDRVLCVYNTGSGQIAISGKTSQIERGRGTTFSLFRGAGSQIILAYLPPHKIKSLYLMNVVEIASAGLGETWKEFRTTLNKIRSQGYAQTIGRTHAGMYSIAVPILKSDGRAVGSVLILGATNALDEGFALLDVIKETARLISQELNE